MTTSEAESIIIYLPKFLGKTYYFVIYQGENCITISQGIIPVNGRIIIDVSQKYKNYKGMGRLLIYDHACEAAGLDVYIPGGNFSIHCESLELNKENTKYINNRESEKLDELSQMHDNIVNRYLAMQMAVSVFSKESENYNVFNTECIKQQNLYKFFQIQLERNNDDASKLLQIDIISREQGTQLMEGEKDRASNTVDCIANNLNWNVLYTSGYWMKVIDLWIRLHTTVLKDQKRFNNDYKKISLKLEPKLYNGFRNRTLYNLKNYHQGKKEWYKILSKNKLNK
ncbi:alkyl hydroperoxide reductase [Chryseobacterium sp. PMSZPI]|uniref:alkyl hydroperoxide reductase n=1 Tax=Chryseobacterium sp. PMSZPI TaxID=1033900 RepID=UPI0039A3417D